MCSLLKLDIEISINAQISSILTWSNDSNEFSVIIRICGLYWFKKNYLRTQNVYLLTKAFLPEVLFNLIDKYTYRDVIQIHFLI